LLRFAKDRQRWLQWLFEAKKRYGLVILNYMATSNHIHMLVFAGGGRDVIPITECIGFLRLGLLPRAGMME
jgi:putative transposase